MSKYSAFARHEPLLERVLLSLVNRLLASAYLTYAGLDWPCEAEELRNPTVYYPDYYLVPHHGLREGYLSPCQALSWQFIERLFRIAHVQPTLLALAAACQPRSILDLGCGTGTISLALAQSLPASHLTLLDLSPYQLAAARRQAQIAELAPRTTFLHASAEATGLADEQVDLVLASLLFHELPRPAACAVIHEAYRLLPVGGHFIAFDAIQCAVPWSPADRAVNRLLAWAMHEVYWTEYMQQPLWETCHAAGFTRVQRQLIFALPWIYQVVTATK